MVKLRMDFGESSLFALGCMMVSSAMRRGGFEHDRDELLIALRRAVADALSMSHGIEELVGMSPSGDPSFRKDEDGAATVDDDMRSIVALRAEADLLATAAKAIDAAIETLGNRVIDDFSTRGVQSVSLEGSTFFISTRRFASIRKENRAQAIEILEGAGLRDMLTVNAQTFASWYNEQVEAAAAGALENDGLPVGLSELCEVYEKPRLSIRKS